MLAIPFTTETLEFIIKYRYSMVNTFLIIDIYELLKHVDPIVKQEVNYIIPFLSANGSDFWQSVEDELKQRKLECKQS